MVVRATPADFGWFSATYPALSDGYCLTLVEAMRPAQVLSLLDARDHVTAVGLDAAMAGLSTNDPPALLVMTEPAEGWCLLVEPNGSLGQLPDVLAVLSRAGRVVSHAYVTDGTSQFSWFEAGLRQLQFEPLSPDVRWGSAAKTCDQALREAGIDPTGAHEEFGLLTEASFALAQDLTGVVVTAELLATATFSCGTDITYGQPTLARG